MCVSKAVTGQVPVEYTPNDDDLRGGENHALAYAMQQVDIGEVWFYA